MLYKNIFVSKPAGEFTILQLNLTLKENFMIKQTIFLFLLLFSILPVNSGAIPLDSVFQTAPPLAGYDKVLILQPNQLYIGGFISFNQTVAVWGNGATIDLQGSGIIAVGKGILDVDGCVFVNGAAAINVSDEVKTTVSNCVFYRNTYGVQH